MSAIPIYAPGSTKLTWFEKSVSSLREIPRPLQYLTESVPEGEARKLELVFNTIDGEEYTGARVMSTGIVEAMEGSGLRGKLAGLERFWMKAQVGKATHKDLTLTVITVTFAAMQCPKCDRVLDPHEFVSWGDFLMREFCSECSKAVQCS